MGSLSETVDEMRAEYCEGCREKFSREEILNGKKCSGCKKAGEVGRTVAGLRD